MRISFDARLEGDASVTARMLAVGPGVAERLAQLVRGTVQDLRAKAMSLAPYRTGALRSSIEADVKVTRAGSVVATLTVGEFYGRFQEFGVKETTVQVQPAARQVKGRFVLPRPYTRRFSVPAHPFMRPALDALRPRMVNDCRRAVADVMDNVWREV